MNTLRIDCPRCGHGQTRLCGERGSGLACLAPRTCPECGSWLLRYSDARPNDGPAPAVEDRVANITALQAQLTADWVAEERKRAAEAREDRAWRVALWILLPAFLFVFWRGLWGLALMALRALGVM